MDSWIENNEEHLTFNIVRSLITFETDIILVVRVPVLSLHITVVQPNVSTDGSDLTIAFSRAILFVPRAKHLLNGEEKHDENKLMKM